MIKQQKQNLPNSTMEYFTQLLNNKQHQNTQHQLSSYQRLQNHALDIAEQTYQQIVYGQFQVKDIPDSIEQIIPQSKNKCVFNNSIDQIDKKIKQNQQILKQAKREMILHKKQQQQANKLEHQIKIQQNQQKLREWTEKQKYYQKRRLELAQNRQLQIERMKQLQKQQFQKQKQQQMQERRISLQKRLKTLSQSRQHRKQLYQQTLQHSKHIPQPKYKQIQQHFQKQQTQQQHQRQTIKKNNKLTKQVNFNLIRQHQKYYLQQLQEKIKLKRGYSSSSSAVKSIINQQDKQLMESRFKSLLKRNQEQVEKEKQKFQRRLSYQSRIKEVEVATNDEKRIKIQIERDKTRNIFKYNFLRQKHFTDQQIFNQFKDFTLDANGYQLGKKYLKQARKIGQQSQMKKSNSQSGISTNSQLPSQRYTNYLPQIKARRSSNNDSQKKLLTPRDIEQTAKRMGNNQKVLEKISKSLKKYDETILNKKLQLQSLKMVSSTIKKEREIDQLYMKSLKAKLACLEISYK